MIYLFCGACCFFFCFSLVMTLKSGLISRYLMCRRARKWPQAEIKVKEATVENIVYNNQTFDKVAALYSYKVDQTFDKVAALYSYKVGGREYESSCINPFYDVTGEIVAGSIFQNTLLSEPLLYCRYNPRNPEQSLLITKVKLRWLGKSMLGIVFMIFALILFVIGALFGGFIGTPVAEMIQFAQ